MGVATEMDYLQAIQRFVDEVEEKVEESIDIDGLIEMTYISKFHFYRLFKAVSGISVYDYIRKRKLTRAATELRISRSSVLDIAIQYGFGSHEVFTRNFKKMYDMTPVQYRSKGNGSGVEETNSRMDVDSIWLDIKVRHGHVVVEEKYEKLEHVSFVGIERQSHDENTDTIFPFIQSSLEQVEQISNRRSDAVFRLCYDITYAGELAYFKEMIAVEVDGLLELSEIPAGMKQMSFHGLNMLKFVHKGKLFDLQKDTILSTYHFIYQYRIPASNAQLTSELLLEKYNPTFDSPYSDDAEVEIFVSVQ
jgi:AraC family transcriptional regulator